MYPYISDLINDIFGTDIRLPAKTFGFFLAMAFVVAYIVLKRELIRREKAGHFHLRLEKVKEGGPLPVWELVLQVFLWGLVGYKLGYMFVDYELFYERTDEVLLSAKGYWLTGLLALAVGFFFRFREFQKRKELPLTYKEKLVGPSFYIGPVVSLAFVGGILGSKIFALIEEPPTTFIGFLESLVSFDGLAFLGGLITAAALIMRYLHKRGFNLWTALDAFVPCLILAYAVGRIGCHMSGDGDWGMPNLAPQPEWMAFLPEWLWAFDYPGNVAYMYPTANIGCDIGQEFCNNAIQMAGCTGKYCTVLEKPVFPTSVYETLMGLSIFGILMFLRKRVTYIGTLTGIYLISIGLERMLIENIRVNIRYEFLGISYSQAQGIAFFLILGGIAILTYSLIRKKEPEGEPLIEA